MPSQVMSYYANASNWEKGVPMPPNLKEKEQKEQWEKLPADEKIHQILTAIKQEEKEAPEDQIDLAVMRCWEKTKECVTGAKVTEIGKHCFQCSKAFGIAEAQEKMIVLECLDGEVKIPHYYKGGLAQDSSFFQALFSEKFDKTTDPEEKTNIEKTTYDLKDFSKNEVKNLIKIWFKKEEIQNSQEAYELLFIGHRLDLISAPMKEALLNTVKSWSAESLEDMATACEFVEEMELEGYQLPELQEALQEYFLNAYKGVLKNQPKQKESIESPPVSQNLEARLEQALKNLNIKTLVLEDVDQQFLEKLPEICPQLTTLVLGNVKALSNVKLDLPARDFNKFLLTVPIPPVTDLSIIPLTKLEHLKNLDLTNCRQLRVQSLNELVKIPNLEQLNLSFCWDSLVLYNEMGGSEGLFLHLAKIPKLKHLNVSCDGLVVGSKYLSNLVENNKLESFNITRNDFFLDILCKLSELSHLSSLNLSYPARVTIKPDDTFPRFEQLKELDLRGGSWLDESLMTDLVKNVPNLTSLKLDFILYRFPLHEDHTQILSDRLAFLSTSFPVKIVTRSG